MIDLVGFDFEDRGIGAGLFAGKPELAPWAFRALSRAEKLQNGERERPPQLFYRRPRKHANGTRFGCRSNLRSDLAIHDQPH